MLGENLMEGAWFWKAPIADLAISLVLTTFGEYAQENQLCSPDHFSPGGACGRGIRLVFPLVTLESALFTGVAC